MAPQPPSVTLSLFQPRDEQWKEELWRSLAEELGAEYVEGGHRHEDVVQLHRPDWIVTLDSPLEQNAFFTRLRAPFINRTDVRFTVYRTGILSGVYRYFGAQDIEVGSRLFDIYFRIKGSPARDVRRLFRDPTLQELLRALPRVRVELRGGGSWLRGHLPPGVDELVCRIPGFVRNPVHLRTMFSLFGRVLDQLSVKGAGLEDDGDALLLTLDAPGGTIEDPGGIVLWDGGLRRRVAAGLLGELGDPAAVPGLVEVLADEDIELRHAAILGLGRIGDGRAIRHLVPFLGVPSRPGRPSTRDLAAAALHQIGAQTLVDAFDRAVIGDTDDLAVAVAGYRDEMVQALLASIDTISRTANIARALAVLGASEALPELRRRSRGYGIRTEITDACAEAVTAIEARASLPRPATRSPATKTESLPRPAPGPEPESRRLPRPSDRPDPD